MASQKSWTGDCVVVYEEKIFSPRVIDTGVTGCAGTGIGLNKVTKFVAGVVVGTEQAGAVGAAVVNDDDLKRWGESDWRLRAARHSPRTWERL